MGLRRLVLSTVRRHLPISINRKWYNLRYGGYGDEFINEDWDNLLILDAARPDILRELGVFEGKEVQDRYSPASYSLGFMKAQFEGRNLHDTVYVTTNPHVLDLKDGIFHKVEYLDDSWDEEKKTFPPDAVVEAAIRANENYPDKRLIVHFMQPHYPFIGGTSNGFGEISPDGTGGPHPWNDHMDIGKPSHDDLIYSYKENHELVSLYAKKLVKELPNKSVITADHSNLIGVRGFPIPIRLYGHPRNFSHPDLLRVPWIEYDGKPRNVTKEPPEEEVEAEDVKAQLEALGYR